METFSALLALCAENSPVIGELPSHSFDGSFDLRQNKRLSKKRCRWFETPSCPLWRHCIVVKSAFSRPSSHGRQISTEAIFSDQPVCFLHTFTLQIEMCICSIPQTLCSWVCVIASYWSCYPFIPNTIFRGRKTSIEAIIGLPLFWWAIYKK